MVAMAAMAAVVTAETADDGTAPLKGQDEWIYFAAHLWITVCSCTFVSMSILVSWTMKDENRYCTLHYNHNMSTIEALLAVTSSRIHRISGFVELGEGVRPFLAFLAFSEAHRHYNSPSMTGKPAVSVTFDIDFVGESKVWISWRVESHTWC